MKKILMLFLSLTLVLVMAVVSVLPSSSTSSGVPDTDTDISDNYDGYEPNGDSTVGNNIVKSALTKIGCKYVWGAEGPNEFDCSGLVWWAMNENGVKFTRTTAAVLSTMGQEIEVDDLQPGDIITFRTIPSYVSHVGIYIGDGKMVHAPNPETPVKVEPILNSKYWMSVMVNCRRLY